MKSEKNILIRTNFLKSGVNKKIGHVNETIGHMNESIPSGDLESNNKMTTCKDIDKKPWVRMI